MPVVAGAWYSRYYTTTGESAADFAARQEAFKQFDTRQQSLAGLAPQVAAQDALQQQAQQVAEAQV